MSFSHVPKCSNVTSSNDNPTFSVITVAPVNTAISSNIAKRFSPNPGAFTATTFRLPRTLFTTNVDNASPSISSAMITIDRSICITDSNNDRTSFVAEIRFSYNKINGLDNSACIFSFVTKYGDRYPLSNYIPSTISNVVSAVLPSSTVMTPSLPTRSMAAAIISPIALSLFAEIVAP